MGLGRRLWSVSGSLSGKERRRRGGRRERKLLASEVECREGKREDKECTDLRRRGSDEEGGGPEL